MSTALFHYGAPERRAIMLEKLGGNAVLRQAIDKFYDRQTHDARLMAFFSETDLSILKWHQFNLMSIAFTHVPENFDVSSLILKRHQRLFDAGLDEKYFDIVMEHFENTLKELNVDANLIEEAVGVVKPLRSIFELGAKEARQRKQELERERQLVLFAGAAVVLAVVAIGISRIAKHSKM